VSDDNVKSSGQAKPDAAYQWIRKSNPRKIQVGVCIEIVPYFVLGCQETAESIRKRRRRAWPDVSRRPHSEECLHGRFHRCRKPPAYYSGKGGAPSQPACRARADCWFFHRAQVNLVRRSQVIEALRNAPRTRFGMPAATFFGQVFHEQPSIALRCVKLVMKICDVRK
jgi:hypothetical protein